MGKFINYSTMFYKPGGHIFYKFKMSKKYQDIKSTGQVAELVRASFDTPRL